MEYHSARDMNGLPTHRTAWMSPGMVLSKRRVLADVRFKERAGLGAEEAEWGCLREEFSLGNGPAQRREGSAQCVDWRV